MNCLLREITIRLCDGESSIRDLEGADFMSDVHYLRLPGDAGDNPLHRPGEMVRRAEIGSQSDQWMQHGLLNL